jgi:hypothetical protein
MQDLKFMDSKLSYSIIALYLCAYLDVKDEDRFSVTSFLPSKGLS